MAWLFNFPYMKIESHGPGHLFRVHAVDAPGLKNIGPMFIFYFVSFEHSNTGALH